MKIPVISAIILVALFAWLFHAYSEISVYACSEVDKQSPQDVQQLCAKARKNRPWMN